MPRYAASIYLFNRDLRVEDNELLGHAVANSGLVYPIFVFTPEQIMENKLANARATQFLARSLIYLATKIPITFFVGKTEDVVEKLIEMLGANAVYNNFDVTPYAMGRSDRLKRQCKRLGTAFVQGRDVFMFRRRDLVKGDGSPYVKYTPFYKNALKYLSDEKVAPTAGKTRLRRLSGNGSKMLNDLAAGSANPVFAPGRAAAVQALRRFASAKASYKLVRDRPAADATSHLSAYLHYGILGPNEVARALVGNKNRPDIIRQLLWREFYLYIVWMQHTSYAKLSVTIPSHNKVRWVRDPRRFALWCKGQTGCPIVDAGMRELNETGYMQNRARMIVATFLIFYLHINWTMGELYFARNLVDYDYCNNLGGWMWCAAWEVHSNEFFRPLSVSSQMRRFDPQGDYVKRWVPELAGVEARDLYDWPASRAGYTSVRYATPIILDLKKAREAGVELYKKARGK